MTNGLSGFLLVLAGLIDLLLNTVALLLWFNWRTASVKLAPAGKLSLRGTLQRTEQITPHRWMSLGALLLLLVLRALFYWRVGGEVNWIAKLDLTAIALPFRSDVPMRMFAYSLVSFGVVLGGFYASLLLLSIINPPARESSDHSLSQLVVFQLGWPGRWPWPLRLMLAPVVAAALWGFGHPMFVKLGVLPAPHHAAHVWQQAAVMAVASMLAWKYAVSLLLFGGILNTYVFLGDHEIWRFVARACRNLTRPLRWLPLRIGKFDLAPILLLAGVLAGAHWAGRWLTVFYQKLPL